MSKCRNVSDICTYAVVIKFEYVKMSKCQNVKMSECQWHRWYTLSGQYNKLGQFGQKH